MRMEDFGLKSFSGLLFPAATTNELLNTRSQIKCKLWEAEVLVAPQLMWSWGNRTDFMGGTLGAQFEHTGAAATACWAIKTLLRLKQIYFGNKLINNFCDKSVLFFEHKFMFRHLEVNTDQLVLKVLLPKKAWLDRLKVWWQIPFSLWIWPFILGEPCICCFLSTSAW